MRKSELDTIKIIIISIVATILIAVLLNLKAENDYKNSRSRHIQDQGDMQ
jgi:uncharacterized protein YpmB